jgi:hypothetical protein
LAGNKTPIKNCTGKRIKDVCIILYYPILYADWFKKKGDVQGAKEHLTKAIDLFQECGADGWVMRTEKALAEFS